MSDEKKTDDENAPGANPVSHPGPLEPAPETSVGHPEAGNVQGQPPPPPGQTVPPADEAKEAEAGEEPKPDEDKSEGTK